jgi:hypothetical protein
MNLLFLHHLPPDHRLSKHKNKRTAHLQNILMLPTIITLSPGGEVLIHFICFSHQVLELRR